MITIPVPEAMQSNACTGEEAAKRLGATHTLAVDAQREPGKLRVRSSLEDLRTRLRLPEFSQT